MFFLIALAIVIIFASLYIGTYNAFIKNRNRVEETWAQIDVQLKRRCDLIPNLVETVKGFARHEQDTLEKVIAARNSIIAAGNSPQQQLEANNQLTGALRSVFALSESYPELKANDSFVELQQELSTTENKVAYSRQLYNSTVMNWNNRVESFPSNIIANLHHFEKKEMLSITETERETPSVKF